MRTKTLLLTAALSAVSIATAMAQTVYSVNAVGYVNVTVPAGQFSLLANPLNQPTNTLAAILPDAPNNTKVFVYNPTTGFSDATKRVIGGTGSWTGPAANTILNPGQGFFIQAPAGAALPITFVGEVPQGTGLTVPLAAGINLIGSIVPQAGRLTQDLGMTAANQDTVFQWDAATQGYKPASTFRVVGGTGQWTGGGEPNIAVAEGFFYRAGAAGSWTRNFSVNQ